MNKKSGFVLRMVAGLYLSYLGIALFSQAMRDKPSDYMMKAVIAVIFLGVGVWSTIRNIRALYQLTMGDSGDKHKKDASGETGSKKEFAKPQHDKTKFRTAPMPVLREDAGKSLAETDLHTADLKEDKETDDSEIKDPGDQETEEIPKDETQKDETQKNETQKNETAREEDENVIELDLAQEEETGKSEELENDYEEK